ncbi:MAG: DUF4445 domain-containing protein [Chloroflexi bacterium]|nr:MAG: DUF4445 domain-containing protein [Chloroflexota bacterium]
MPSETPKKKFIVDLEPIGRRVEVEAGTNLLEAAQKAGIDLVASCGGIGICGTCRVRIAHGEVTPITLTEEESLDSAQFAAGFRLACQTEPLSDVRLDIPPDSLTAVQQMQVEGREGEVELAPVVVAVDLALEKPHLEDLRSDLARVDEELTRQGYAPLKGRLSLIGQLSLLLRKSGWKARLAIRPEKNSSTLVAVLPPGALLAGLAMDLGSTKLALYLVDLASGATLARAGVMNPQIAYGEDVVSRIAYANKAEENRRILQTRLVETINQVVANFCQELSLQQNQVVDIVAVGNTAMHHLFSGLPVEQLGSAPYVPVVSEPLEFEASEIGLVAAPGARIFMPANIAGYVGADHVSALLATQSYAAHRTTLVADIGTNTEISLTHQGRVYSCSCASGPAFEGAHIHDGMRAAPGAIDRVHINDGRITLSTINNEPPVGICGSGILNAVAQMLEAGIIDERGVLRGEHERIRAKGRQSEFVLAQASESGHGRDVVVTRKDVNEIQLAKGAIRAGIEILLQKAGIPAEAIEEFIIAGAFGTFLDLGSALRVGMFPVIPLERYHQVGNAAGVGAKEMLISRARRAEAAQIVNGVNYIELTTYSTFTPQFVEAMYFHPPFE